MVRDSYGHHSERWDHEHCEFCTEKFMDPSGSGTLDTRTLTEGCTTTVEQPHGADYHWVCIDCCADFADEFRWNSSGEPPSNERPRTAQGLIPPRSVLVGQVPHGDDCHANTGVSFPA